MTDGNLFYLNEKELIDSFKEYNQNSFNDYKKHKFLLDINDTLQYIYKYQLNEDLEKHPIYRDI